MNTILLIIAIALLIYIIYVMKLQTDSTQKTNLSYEKILPNYLNKMCEIAIKEPLVSIDVMFSIKGTLLDCDDEWLLMEVENKKKKTLKMFRIDNISSIKELV